MQDNFVRDKLINVEYYERIYLYSYYHKGKLIKLDSSCELIMLNISSEGIEIVTDKKFDEKDILLINIRFDGIPFDKILGNVKCIKKVGEMYRVFLDFIGIPNFLFDKLKNIKNNQTNLDPK